MITWRRREFLSLPLVPCIAVSVVYRPAVAFSPSQKQFDSKEGAAVFYEDDI